MCLALAKDMLPQRGLLSLQHGRAEQEYMELLHPGGFQRRRRKVYRLLPDIDESAQAPAALAPLELPALEEGIVDPEGADEEWSDLSDCLEALLLEEERQDELRDMMRIDDESRVLDGHEMHRSALREPSSLNHNWGRISIGPQTFGWPRSCQGQVQLADSVSIP